MTTEWKAFEWTCPACQTHSLRVLTIALQLDGRFVFSLECVTCREDEVYAFYYEELVLMSRDLNDLNRFIYPNSSPEERRAVRLTEMFRCEFCHGRKCAIRTLEYSAEGLRLSYYCDDCEYGSTFHQEVAFPEIFAFRDRERKYLMDEIPSDTICFDEIERSILPVSLPS
jgi:hypothetical protein